MSQATSSQSASPVDRPTAMAALVMNLLVCPGFGSVSVKRRVGYLQAALALAGMSLTLWPAVVVAQGMVTNHHIVMPEGRPLAAGVLGVLGFGAAWFWGLATSLNVLRACRTPPPPLPPRI